MSSKTGRMVARCRAQRYLLFGPPAAGPEGAAAQARQQGFPLADRRNARPVHRSIAAAGFERHSTSPPDGGRAQQLSRAAAGGGAPRRPRRGAPGQRRSKRRRATERERAEGQLWRGWAARSRRAAAARRRAATAAPEIAPAPLALLARRGADRQRGAGPAGGRRPAGVVAQRRSLERRRGLGAAAICAARRRGGRHARLPREPAPAPAAGRAGGPGAPPGRGRRRDRRRGGGAAGGAHAHRQDAGAGAGGAGARRSGAAGAGWEGRQACGACCPLLRCLPPESHPVCALPRTQGRVGGRIHTVPFGGGLAELGAQFIWGAESHVDSVPRRRGNRVTEASWREAAAAAGTWMCAGWRSAVLACCLDACPLPFLTPPALSSPC